MTIYQKMKAAGVPIRSHYSDLYVPVNPTTRAILRESGRYCETFTNQVEGGLWFDVPMAFDPYWESREVRP